MTVGDTETDGRDARAKASGEAWQELLSAGTELRVAQIAFRRAAEDLAAARSRHRTASAAYAVSL